MKKKGFTLIELLAVIIILAVIALIATPIILNIIDNARKSAAEASVRGYADAIKLARYDYMFAHDGAEPTSISDLGNLKNYYDGATVTCTTTSLDKGVVTLAGCTVSNYSGSKFNYKNGKVTVSEAGAPSKPEVVSSPTWESKTVSESEVVITYSTTEEASNIKATKCYYGKTENNISSEGTASEGSCSYPVEAAHAKVCHVSYSDIESCSESKKLAEYLILDGDMLVEFETVGTDITQNNGYITLEIDESIERKGIYAKDPIDLSQYAGFYAELDLTTGTTYTEGTTASFQIVSRYEPNISKNEYGIVLPLLVQDNIPAGWEQSVEKKVFSKVLTNIASADYYIFINRYSNRSYVTSNIYNIWLQLSE